MKIEVPSWLDSFSFERLDGGRFVFDVDPEQPERCIDQMSRAITAEYAGRCKDRERKRAALQKQAAPGRLVRLDTLPPPKWLKPVCYNAILTCLHWDVFDCLEGRIERFDRLERGRKAQRSFFMIGLWAIFAHVPPVESDLPRKTRLKLQREMFSDDKGRIRMAEDMWWAFRHYVEPSELVAFTRKHRASWKALVASNDYVLPTDAGEVARYRILSTFTEQVACRRSMINSPVEERRRGYDADVERLTAAYVKEADAAMRDARDTPDEDEDWSYGGRLSQPEGVVDEDW